MSGARLSLIVLRSEHLDRAAEFYEAIGLQFQREQHGSAPIHFAAEWNGLVMEIYPASERFPAESSTRIGFVVDDYDEVNRRLLAAGARQRSIDTSACLALYADPDGRTVEIRRR